MTRQELKAQYYGAKSEKEKRQEVLVYAIYRPISFFVTPLFLKVPVSANLVSMMAMAMGFLMPLLAFLTPHHAYLWLAFMSFGCLVLDCVDGNIARSLGSASKLGQYLDSMSGKARLILLLLALGVVAAHEVPDVGIGVWLSISLLAGLLDIWGRESRAYFKLHLARNEGSLVEGSVGIKNLALSVTSLVPFGLILLGPLQMTHLLLCGLLVVHGTVFVVTQRVIFSRL
jgi:phosphatidylglycerophosphate synthase